MRAVISQLALSGQKRAVSRAVALAVGTACIVLMAVGGGAVASASSAGSAAAAKSAELTSRTNATATPQVAGVPDTSWPAYLDGPMHHSYAPVQTAITPSNATSLTQQWSAPFTQGAPFVSSPIVNRGSVYIGGDNGWFYRLSESTGAVLASTYVGKQPTLTCPGIGVTSTATIMQNPSTHVLTVYVAGGDGYLYALRALTLKPEWRSVIAIPSTTVSNYYDWSSPTVANGKIYIGISSNCDRPLVRGAVVAYNQATGAKLAEFYTTLAGPKNHGASVWSSIAVAPSGYVFATTGNGPVHRPLFADGESILKLSPNTLSLVARFQIPASDLIGDSDFGASPVLFNGLVGACNKNGRFYVRRQRDMSFVWTAYIGHPAGPAKWGACLAAPVFNGKDLFFGLNHSTDPAGADGSVAELNPSTGAVIWSTPLPGGVMGSPSMDGSGVLAVGTFSPGTTGVFLINAANGQILTPSPVITGMTFSQPVFAENELFLADSTGLYAFGVPSTP
jgi:outer membrane protein assembly factor BamB